jgi:uncharacterized protein with von Willebrand factor type A (vWA) domain
VLNGLLLFCSRLRELGLDIGPGHATEAAQALQVVDLTDREQVFLALRVTLCRQVEHFDGFQIAFDEVWGGRTQPTHPGGPPSSDPVSEPGSAPNGSTADKPRKTPAAGGDSVEEVRGVDEEGATTSYSAALLLKRDVGTLEPQEIPEFERLAQVLARRLAQRLSMRLYRRRHGGVDPARTMRRALQLGGEVLQIRHRQSKREKVRLVSLLDVSGSMQPYGRFLLIFLMALAAQIRQMETYVFSTGLCRVTRELRDGDLNRVLQAVPDWGGGTRIGDSMAMFLDADAAHWVDRRTILLVMSDGLDTGGMETLHDAMAKLQGMAGRIIWLNPLAGDPTYEPLARGMRTALPFLDLLASAHNLESLLKLESYIKGGAV